MNQMERRKIATGSTASPTGMVIFPSVPVIFPSVPVDRVDKVEVKKERNFSRYVSSESVRLFRERVQITHRFIASTE